MLQYLISCKNFNPTIEEIYEELINCFAYDAKTIDYYIEKLRSFGLIDSEIDKKIFLNKVDMVYKISAKGSFLLSKIFSSIEMLYYFSLDTYLPDFMFEDGMVDSHNIFDRPRKYHVNCMKTGLLFIKFLLTIEFCEKEVFYRNPDDSLLRKKYYKNYQLFKKHHFDEIEKFVNEKSTLLKDDKDYTLESLKIVKTIANC
ncbi:MAG: hypothetical protein IPN76_31965 [Saprospiraceae bacterium]|nr:hypothetical protein [Saprospiraceae bacterium]